MFITAHLNKLQAIYGFMDRAYNAAADFYQFDCRGCRDNCCTAYFYHYTIVEYLYLLRGFWTLEEGRKEEIIGRAMVMCDPLKRDKYLCPLNENGRCLLYPYRAMICRLHGLPFEFKRRDGQRDEGPGCAKFEKERGLKGLPYRKIERTPFYTDLANLEREVRAEIPHFRRFKKTIAEMIRDGGREGDLTRVLESLREQTMKV